MIHTAGCHRKQGCHTSGTGVDNDVKRLEWKSKTCGISGNKTVSSFSNELSMSYKFKMVATIFNEGVYSDVIGVEMLRFNK